ncbi:MAG TPA: dihydrodipicolinate synthase family protein [Anaerolineales bacterium]|nr:dihydrodipicolinate synthase family protein [Anaerolineales bacterium]
MKIMRHPLAGVYAAAVTPLQSDSALDLEAVAPFLSFLASRGCDGALLFGTTGEGPSFSPSERADVWRAALRVREEYPNFRLLAGTGTPSLSETMDLTKLAFELGFDAVVTLPPYYFRRVNEDGLFNYFEQVIRKAVPSDGYLFGYHIPNTSGIGFSFDLLARLKDSFPNQFAGIKDSSHDETFSRTLGEKFGADLTVFNGTDSDFTLALQSHAAGCITALANIISPGLREIYDLFIQGKDTSAAQDEVSAQRHLLEKYQPFPPLLKAILARLHHQPRWGVRPPLVELSKEDEEKVVLESSEGNKE